MVWETIRKYGDLYDLYNHHQSNLNEHNVYDTRSYIRENFDSFENDELFWEYTNILISKLEENFGNDRPLVIEIEGDVERTYKKKTKLIKKSIDDFWDTVVTEIPDIDLYIRYYRTYMIKTKNLHIKLYGVVTSFGDDGFDDVMDSFPLFGEDRFNLAMNSQIIGTSMGQCQGENYMASRIREKIEHFLSTQYGIILQIPDIMNIWGNSRGRGVVLERFDNLSVLYIRDRDLETLIEVEEEIEENN